MKKFILCAAAISLSIMGFAARPLTSISSDMQRGPKVQLAPRIEAPVTCEDAEGYDIQLCGKIDTWYGLQTAGNYFCYIYVTPEIATQLAGNQVTEISFSCYFKSAQQLQGYVYVCEDINQEPQAGGSVMVRTANANRPVPTKGTLTSPYTIKANTGFYLCYEVVDCTATDYPIGVDGNSAGIAPGGVIVYSGDTRLKQIDLAENDCNLFIMAKTVGPATTLKDIFTLDYASLSTMPLPTLTAGEESVIYLTFNNIGNNEITEVTYMSMTVDGDLKSETASINVPGKSSATVQIPSSKASEGRNEMVFMLTEINGIPAEYSALWPYIGVTESYKRAYLVEEFTGTWCGYCPQGIVGMEYMQKNHPDEFIGIAVHTGDNMAVSSYKQLIDEMSAFGVPSSLVNRAEVVFPLDSEFERSFQEWKSIPGAAKVEIADAYYTPKTGLTTPSKVHVDINATFGYDDPEADYSLAVVLTEDGQVDVQTNYFAGAGAQAPGVWGYMDEYVQWTYTHTARDIYSVWGLANSVPKDVVKGTPYNFQTSVNANRLKDLEKSHVIVLLLDNNSGVVLNAAIVNGIVDSGVSDVAADSPAKVYAVAGGIEIAGAYNTAWVYDTAGRLVAKANGAERIDLAAGLYVVNVDGAATKVLVK